MVVVVVVALDRVETEDEDSIYAAIDQARALNCRRNRVHTRR